RRRHTRFSRDWSSDVCSSDLELSNADIFQRVGEKTPLFCRFSTVAGNKGSFDLARDVRGFAVKMYTKEGNWDLVGNNIPVFFIRSEERRVGRECRACSCSIAS